MKHLLTLTFLVLVLATQTRAQSSGSYYKESLRPQYHFTPERNWMGDPCGLVYYDDEYHLFYQYNPKGDEPGYYHWGHAKSKDLIHWEHLPVAIFPDNLSEDAEYCTIGPGSTIIDANNLLGVEKGEHKTMVAFYTSRQCGQRIAFSNDKGHTWTKYRGNPVIPFDENDYAEGPKVFWYEQGQHWVMALFRIPDNEERKRGISFYTSDDLVNWEYQSHLPGFTGTPDMVELRVNNRPDDKKWLVFEGDGSYVIGSFDGKSFVPESIRMRSDFGRHFYAAKTFNNPIDGRIIQMAWMRGAEYPDMPFNGQMTFPSELTLRKFNMGTFMIRQPIREIENIQGKKITWEKENLIPGLNANLVKKAKGELLLIKGQFDLKSCDSFGFLLRHSKKNQGMELLYNVKRQTLTMFGQSVGIEPVDNKIYLDILIDRNSVEVYANNGRAVITNAFLPDENGLEYVLYNSGGELFVDKLEFIELKPVWGGKR